MAEIRSAEAQRIVQRLLKELEDSQTLKTTTSTNSLKKIRRGLGALLFSPDAVGYIDVIDNKMRKGESPKQILSSIAGKSERLVKSYSPIPGVFEAHHIIALNSLRDSFMGLSADEQDKFLKKLADAGWEIGDSPKQLVDTVLTRMSHVGQQIKAPIDSDTGTIRRLKMRGRAKLRGFKEHAHLKRILAGPAKTADDLITIFNKKIAPESIKAATTGLLQDANFRAYMETRGFPLDKVTPQIVSDYYSDPVKTQGFLNSISEGLGEFDADGLGREAIEQGQERLIKEAGPGMLTDPEGVAQAAGQLQIDRIGPLDDIKVKQAQNVMTKLARRSLYAGATFSVLGGIAGVGDRGVQAKEAEEAGDQAGVAKAGAQLGGEIAAAAFPVADVVNIGTDVASTYGELREAGVTHKQMGQAALNLAGKAIQNPGKAVGFVREAVADIPERTMEGFNFLANKYRQANMSLSGYSPF
tara:strand:+ start:1 stop:1410 length:1410 start_codon:yes stop_codon:yes gene_type:complete